MQEINLKDKPLSNVIRRITSILGAQKASITEDRAGYIVERTDADMGLYHLLIIKKFVDPHTKETTYTIETDEGTLSPRKSVNAIKYIDLREIIVTFPNVLFGANKKVFIETLNNQGIKKLFEFRRNSYATHSPEYPKEFIQKKMLSFKKGEVIFKEGTMGVEMYIIQKGLVGLFKETPVCEIQLAELKENNFFGEMALMEKSERSASARALEDTELLIVNKELFEFQLNKIPNWFITMFTLLIDQLRNANEMIKILQRQIINETPHDNRYANMDSADVVKRRIKKTSAEESPRLVIHH